jgi:hypothetical protein
MYKILLITVGNEQSSKIWIYIITLFHLRLSASTIYNLSRNPITLIYPTLELNIWLHNEPYKYSTGIFRGIFLKVSIYVFWWMAISWIF